MPSQVGGGANGDAVGPPKRVSLWLVYGEYETSGGIIQAGRVEGGRFYDPVEADELPEALAAVASGGEDDVLDFVRRYGFLGINLINPNTPPLQERIDWVQAHARGVRLVMEALYATNHQDTEAALNIVEPRLRGKTIHWGIVGLSDAAIPLTSQLSLVDASVALNHLALVAERILNEHLQRIRRRVAVIPDQGGPRIVNDHSITAMVDVVYAKLADRAMSQAWRRCAECGAPFHASHPRQKFCPPRFGEHESRCSMRYRQRAFRQRQRDGGNAEEARSR